MKKTLILFVCNLFLMNLFAGTRDGGLSTIVQNTYPQNTQEAHSMRDIFLYYRRKHNLSGGVCRKLQRRSL